MPVRIAAVTGAVLVLLAGAGLAVWWYSQPVSAPPVVALPVPPFPPRIASGEAYEQCLAALTDDPDSARAIAEGWVESGGGDGAAHCQGLALIASGDPEGGAERLEQLARGSLAPDLARASVLGQAAQARLMAGQADRAYEDATLALALAPTDTELLIERAMASAERDQLPAAIDDLSHALRLDARRTDALVLRAGAWRQQDRLDLALADTERAISIDPDDAEALLERGIVRQRMGDPDGARADWLRALELDPNSTTAELAEQNLALLAAGPAQR